MDNRIINLGISGLGRAFTLMLPTFVQDPRIRLVAAFDPRENARSQFAREFGADTHDTFDDLAANSEVDVIYIASPHQHHAEQACTAAGHGKHVLVEKPMALTLTDCDRMLEACSGNGVQLIVGHSHSFDTPYLRAREIIRRSEFGQVKMLHAVNYTDFLYRPRRPEELKTESGGGVIFNQAIHQVDILRLLSNSPATRLRAVTGSWDSHRPTEGAYAALLWFENGAFASFSYSGYGHFDSDEWCNWVGETGTRKNGWDYAASHARLGGVTPPEDETTLKYKQAYGSGGDHGFTTDEEVLHQHFGSVIVSCEFADIRPMADAIHIE